MHSHFLPRFARNALALAMTAALCAPPAAADLEWYNGRWAHETSDVKADPSVTFGYLKNGLRWAYIPNKTPAGRLTIRLNVQTGSLMEDPDALGVAHYLEHLAFNGSKNYPSGSLVPFFQKHGMSFGGDTNAHTAFAETVYKLNLATNDQASMAEGMKVLRDMADGLLLEEKEVDEERGIIFSEKRAGEEEWVLAGREWRSFLYKGTLVENLPIGTTDTLNGITSEHARRYYEKWYVPGRMTVVVAGEADPKAIEAAVEKAFGSMKAQPLPTPPDIGTPDLKGTKAFVQKRDINGTNVGIYIMYPRPKVVDNEARQRRLAIETLIGHAVDMRMAGLAAKHPTILTEATWYNAHFDWFTPQLHFNALTTKENWKPAMKLLREEMRRVEKYGITAEEFELVKRQYADSLAANLARRDAWPSDRFADFFIAVMNAGKVFTSYEQDVERFKEIEKTLTLDEVNAVVDDLFAPDNRRLKVSGNAVTTEEEVLDFWKAIEKTDVAPPAANTVPDYPYLPTAESAPDVKFVTEKLPVDDYDLTITKATLPNGVEIVLQPLPFEKGIVISSLVFGDGLKGVKDADVPTAQLAERVLRRGGIGHLSAAETKMLFSGSGIAVNEVVTNNFNEIRGQGLAHNVPRMIEAMYTQFADPTLTEGARLRTLEIINRLDFERHHEIKDALNHNWKSHFMGERKLAHRVVLEDAEKVTLDAMKAYLKDARQRGKRLLIIAGDFDVKEAGREAARLFSRLPAAKEGKRSLEAPLVFPKTKEKILEIDAVKDDKANILVGWRADQNVHDRRLYAARELAANVIKDRMRVTVREKLAVAYSPYCFYRLDETDGGFGLFLMEVQTEADRIDEVRQVLDDLGQEILKNGITKEEVERMRKPRKTAWATQRKRSFPWMLTLEDSMAIGLPYLEWNEALGGYYDRVTFEEVEREAKNFFKGEQTTLVVKPRIN